MIYLPNRTTGGLAAGSAFSRVADLDLYDQKDLATLTRTIWDGRQFKRHLEREFITNVCFLKGGVHQHFIWDDAKFDMVMDRNLPKDAQLVTINMLLVFAEVLVSSITRPGLDAKVHPVSDEEMDIQKARILEDVLNYMYSTGLRFDLTLARMMMTAICSPVVWIKAFWNPHKGDIVSLNFDDFLGSKIEDAFPDGIDDVPPQERQEIIMLAAKQFIEMFGERAGKMKQINQYEGQLDNEIKTVLDMCWSPWNVKTWDEVEHWVESSIVPIKQAAEMTGLSVEDVRIRRSRVYGVGGTPLSSSPIQRRANTTGILSAFGGDMSQEPVLIHQVYTRKCLDYPEGIYGVVIEDDIEAVGKPVGIPTMDNEHPFVPFVQIDIPEQAWGTCMVSQCRSLQMDWNHSVAQENMYRDRQIFGTTVIKQSSIVDEDNPGPPRDPRQVWVVQGEMPTKLQNSTTPLDWSRTQARNSDAMREMSGVPAIQQGNTQGTGVRSGRGVLALKEFSVERFKTSLKKMDALVEQVLMKWAKALMFHPTTEMVAQIIGEENRIELLEFSRESLRPSTFGLRGRNVAIIKIAAFAEMPSSRAETRNLILTLIKGNVFDPKSDKEEIWKLLGGGELISVRDKTRGDRSKQSWEIAQWRKGLTVPRPVWQQNHLVHRNELDEWIRRGTEYHDLCRKFPYMEDHIQAHYRAHVTMELMKAAEIPLLQKRAEGEAWIKATEDLSRDIQFGDAPQQLEPILLSMIPQEFMPPMPGGPQPGGGSQAAGSGIGSPPPPAPAPQQGVMGGAPPEQVPQPAANNPQKLPIGEGMARDERRDLADGGVSLAPR